ncbi:MAG: PAS domain-containing sensor histidine kinase, partial [Marmoricola sp.]|nr:PAS domain-containing sensor histidine kinase [Marmoricola sp.]
GRRLDLAIFDREEFVERAGRLDVPPDLRLLAADLSRLDRRRSNPDLGALDRRRRRDDDPPREGGERRERRGTAADRRAGGGLARDWTLVRPDGERFTASLQVVKVTDDAGEVVGHLGVAHDVTEQRRSRHLLVAGLEREAEALRRLQELDRAKDDFVATVSHELRTPITSILGYVEVLLDAASGGLDGSHVEMLDAVRRNGNRLRALADDLLTLSSFQRDQVTFDPAPLDLGEVVRHVEHAVRPLIADRRLEVTFAVPDEPVVLTGDAALLERMLFHLLSNALKFTEDGGSIACALSATCDTAVLTISDTGIGVPAGERDQLFAPFVRSTTSFERASQGAGMGLAIVSTIVERHAGQVRLESVEHQGTEVTVVLPVKQSAITV